MKTDHETCLFVWWVCRTSGLLFLTNSQVAQARKWASVNTQIYGVSFRELAFLWLNQPNSSERIYRFEPGKTENKKHQNDSFLLS